MEAMTENCMAAEKHKYWKEFESNMHQFFKMLVGDFRQHLRLPKKFVTNFRENLSGTMALRGPSGFIWTVSVTKILDQVIFQNGWQTFVKDHRLGDADMLVFRYIGNSTFNVLIFDPSGCEREGSHFIHEHTNACSNERCVLEKEDEELHMQKKIKRGRGRPRQKVVDTDNHHQWNATEKKKPRVGKSSVERVVYVDEVRVPGCAMQGSGEQSKMKRPVVEKIHMQKKTKRGRGRPRQKVFDTDNHHQSNATEKKKPRVGKSSVERVVLVDEVRVPGCAMEASGEQSKMKRPVVEKIHTQENIKKGTGRSSLKVADNYNSHQYKATEKKKLQVAEREVLVNESDGDSAGEGQNLGKMSRQLDFPASYKLLFISKRREITEEERKRPNILSEQHSSRTRRPSFTVVMKASHVYRGFKMRIPKKWHVLHMVGDVKRAILKLPPENKIWDVGVRTDISGKDFTRGWNKFVLDNNLEEHDACVFELNDEGKDQASGAIVVFNVSIFRVLDEIVPLTKLSSPQCLAITS